MYKSCAPSALKHIEIESAVFTFSELQPAESKNTVDKKIMLCEKLKSAHILLYFRIFCMKFKVDFFPKR